MSKSNRGFSQRLGIGLAVLVAAAVILGSAENVQAQGFFPTRAVGGVSIDPSGILNDVQRDELEKLTRARAEALKQVPGDLSQPSELRKVSLRRLEAAIAQHQTNGTPLADEIQLLAGLQRIEYVFVYPEQQDLVLAGFGEGWKLDDNGNLVGQNTGWPVLLLDDLLTALRSAEAAARGGISCSIDPTPEGLNRLREFVGTLKTIGNPQATSQAIEKVLGPQRIAVGGVPTRSHLAQVLVAADYRMKRIGMGLDDSPVSGLPSYLAMIRGSSRGMSAMAPRWWMVPGDQPLLTDAQGLAWQLRKASVKTLTEETHFGVGGVAQQTGKTNTTAQRWAELMSDKYDELAVKDPIFGELRNVMDLAIVAALITKENLAGKAGFDMSLLLDAGQLPTVEFTAPEQTASKASAVRKGSNWVISASGGVQINSWGIAAKKEQSSKLAPMHVKAAAPATDRWWWD